MKSIPTAEAAAPAPDTAEPPRTRLMLGADGRLRALAPGQPAVAVRPVRCFPWSHAGAYISLRDDAGKEVLLVTRLDELEPASAAALERALAEAGFVLRVRRILAVTEELEIRHWQVETSAGPRRFQTARDEWPRPLPGGALLLRDVAGDLYLIPPTGDLDQASRRALWAFTD